MREISQISLDTDSVIVGIEVDGLWMLTAKWPRLKMALRLLKLALKTIFRKRYDRP